MQRRSVSELMGELLEGCCGEHEADIQGYGDLKKRIKNPVGNHWLPESKPHAVYFHFLLG